MSNRERRKGVVGEREVAEILRSYGFTVRGLEGAGDWLALGHGVTLHVESKRQEVARPWAWGEQAIREAPAGTLPVVAFRRSRSPWWAQVPLSDLLAVLAKANANGNGGA